MTTATHRWRGVVGVALFAAAVGILFKRSAVLLLSATAVGFVVYPRLTSAPDPSLAIEREVDVDTPADGEEVPVTVTLRNTGNSTLTDVRVIDGVPPMLSVADGTPRHTAVLQPGAETTFSYSVTARQGTHRFDPATVFVRDVAGAHEVERQVATDTNIECGAAVPEIPLRDRTGQRVGDLVTDEGGTGIEFYRTRNYRKGDSLSRIDWKRFARTGDLTTVEYREERTASVVLCLDAREIAHRSSGPDQPHAVSYGLGAVEQLFGTLLETPHHVGVAALGPDFCWLSPGSGTEHAARARNLFASNPSLSARPPDEETSEADLDRQVSELRKRLDTETQVVVVSPLPDDDIVQACLQLESTGNPVTLLSPDVTTTETTGTRLALFERRSRIATLRERDVPAVDWEPTQPLGTALVEAQERWSA
ncbi:hypothetical protein BV210_17780 (plasmid) [Halorientalis sp. IM1011]|uniref:DUF58 domain-containing protein n=1 Tax=Halorientalis sp. IM1011 TaxID=1932360 RepID=UPI00097CCA5B|nr:DUF58 domain-containing protein [Halorientalis sp. IM1011]AQL44621.1 hypothetical protein BV210_17780 [Halorientalis sp. IM1011]